MAEFYGSTRKGVLFIVTLIAAFTLSFAIALPLFALGLAAPFTIVTPLFLGMGALFASITSWSLSKLLIRSERGFVFVLLKGLATALVLLVVYPLLLLGGIPLTGWLVPALGMVVIAYRVTAAAWEL